MLRFASLFALPLLFAGGVFAQEPTPAPDVISKAKAVITAPPETFRIGAISSFNASASVGDVFIWKVSNGRQNVLIGNNDKSLWTYEDADSPRASDPFAVELLVYTKDPDGHIVSVDSTVVLVRAYVAPNTPPPVVVVPPVVVPPVVVNPPGPPAPPPPVVVPDNETAKVKVPGFRCLLLYEAMRGIPDVFADKAVCEYLNTHVVKGDDGKTPDWRRKDNDEPAEGDFPIWKLFRETLPAGSDESNYVSCGNGTIGYAGPAPKTGSELLTLLKKYGG